MTEDRARLLVTVPIKDPSEAKTRLDGVMGAKDRRRLALVLAKRTLDLLRRMAEAQGFDLAVVTGSDAVADLATEYHTAVIDEAPGAGLNGALTQAADWALQAGYGRMCVLPADLAAPDRADLIKLFARPATDDVVICPAADLGTNAILLPLPLRFPFCYGTKSAPAHLQAASNVGLNARLLPLESLRYDIDTAGDLALASAPDLARFKRG